MLKQDDISPDERLQTFLADFENFLTSFKTIMSILLPIRLAKKANCVDFFELNKLSWEKNKFILLSYLPGILYDIRPSISDNQNNLFSSLIKFFGKITFVTSRSWFLAWIGYDELNKYFENPVDGKVNDQWMIERQPILITNEVQTRFLDWYKNNLALQDVILFKLYRNFHNLANHSNLSNPTRANFKHES